MSPTLSKQLKHNTVNDKIESKRKQNIKKAKQSGGVNKSLAHTGILSCLKLNQLHQLVCILTLKILPFPKILHHKFNYLFFFRYGYDLYYWN